MRKKILFFHDENKFSKIFLTYVRENLFKEIDIYFTNDFEVIRSSNFDFFLVEEKYKEYFSNIFYKKIYYLVENLSAESMNCGNDIYKYSSVREILSIVMENRNENSEKTVTLLITSYEGGVGKTKIFNTLSSKEFTYEKKTIFLTFDFFQKFKDNLKTKYLAQLIYYIHNNKDVPIELTKRMKEELFKFGHLKLIFSGNPNDFANVNFTIINKLISYLEINLNSELLVIDWPSLIINNTNELLDLVENIIFVFGNSKNNKISEFLDYFSTEYRFCNGKTIFLKNKANKVELSSGNKNLFYLPYIYNDEDEEEFKKCLKMTLDQLLIT